MLYKLIKSSTCSHHAHNAIGRVQGLIHTSLNSLYNEVANFNSGRRTFWECGECKVEPAIETAG